MFLGRKTGWVEILTVHGSLAGLAAIQARLIRRGQTMPWPPEKYCFADERHDPYCHDKVTGVKQSSGTDSGSWRATGRNFGPLHANLMETQPRCPNTPKQPCFLFPSQQSTR
ncbi:hypothetical protein B0H13DRAFT_1064421 [Mycena leptocephala]|nr:hypothetical protein B0H13DRAFT_1064421 [Mycena leptocephala]